MSIWRYYPGTAVALLVVGTLAIAPFLPPRWVELAESAIAPRPAVANPETVEGCK